MTTLNAPLGTRPQSWWQRTRLGRWIEHRLWLLGFPRFKTPIACHTCGRLSTNEHAHLTHLPCERRR